ncbi:hypothetical protein L596_000358 [Steinernema carpocapsae]|uniref:Uncharacterized protein n=1 Tax=Steinernema carpocapsae TaxID=34508 RepID=A0A4U8UHS7_STECR|nr:hypothetical protein L596_000358 [Steinernema carpocapsae]
MKLRREFRNPNFHSEGSNLFMEFVGAAAICCLIAFFAIVVVAIYFSCLTRHDRRIVKDFEKRQRIRHQIIRDAVRDKETKTAKEPPALTKDHLGVDLPVKPVAAVIENKTSHEKGDPQEPIMNMDGIESMLIFNKEKKEKIVSFEDEKSSVKASE